MPFQLESNYKPRGDQGQAIAKLTKSVEAGNRHQTLLGVTGSGKTFTIANVIQALDRPTLVISHNKTLAAQLYAEFKERGRIFRQLFRLLSTGSLHSSVGHLHREGFLDQRRDRTFATGGDQRAAFTPGHDRGCQRLVHLWHHLAGRLPANVAHGETRATDFS